MTIAYKAKLAYLPPLNKPLQACSCHYCENEWLRTMDELDPDGWMSRMGRHMILCPDCGNKRCPKATYHGHDCTGSNDSGQHNSRYGDFKIDTSWMDADDEELPEVTDEDRARFRAKHNLPPLSLADRFHATANAADRPTPTPGDPTP